MTEASAKWEAAQKAFEEFTSQGVKTSTVFFDQAVTAAQIVARAAATERDEAAGEFASFANVANPYFPPRFELPSRGDVEKLADDGLKLANEFASYWSGFVQRQSALVQELLTPASAAAESARELARAGASSAAAGIDWLQEGVQAKS